MKRKKLIIICVTAIIICIIAVTGYINNNRQKNKTENNIEETQTNINSDEEEFEEFIRSEAEQVETEGNFYKQGEYVSFGGFGYRVEEFYVYNSYEELVSNAPEYDIENEYIPHEDKRINAPGDCYVYVKLNVTNESQSTKKKFYCSKPVLLATDDHIVSWDEENSSYFTNCYEFYIGGVSEYVDENDEKNKYSPEIEANQTITMYKAYKCYGYIENTQDSNDDSQYVSLYDVLNAPDWYLDIPGTLNWGGSRLYNLEEKTGDIFIECVPEY